MYCRVYATGILHMIIKPLSHNDLIRDIERFCSDNKFAVSELGYQALKDRAFYMKVKRGLSPTLQRIERVYDFMVAYEQRQGLAPLPGDDARACNQDSSQA